MLPGLSLANAEPEIICKNTTRTSPEGCLVASEFLKINDRASVTTDYVRTGNSTVNSLLSLEIGSNSEVIKPSMSSFNIDVIGNAFIRNKTVTVKSINFRTYYPGISLTTQDDELTSDYLQSKVKIVPNMKDVVINEKTITVGSVNHTVEPGMSVKLMPGNYRNVIVRAEGTLTLEGSGQYTFNSLVFEDSSIFDIVDIKSKHHVLVEKEFRWGDRVIAHHFSDTLTVYTNQGNPQQNNPATQDISINGDFDGKIYAPYSKVIIGNGKNYRGCIFSKKIELHQDSNFIGENKITEKVCECKVN